MTRRNTLQGWNPKDWRRGFPPFTASRAAGSVSPFHPAFELVLNDEAAEAARRGASLAEIYAEIRTGRQRGGTR